MTTKWSKKFLEWTEGDTAFLSVVFSWDLAEAYQRAVWLGLQGYKVRAGGPAVLYNPEYLSGVAEIGGDVPALNRHNPDATFTSKGCIRKCKFCLVPLSEGPLVELEDWEPKPIVCDNNLLACSKSHFDRVIDRLKPIKKIDFNQGLDSRLLTKYHADRIRELNIEYVRLAWDDTRYERQFRKALQTLWDAGIPRSRIYVYVLIGFNDDPEDALYRLQSVRDTRCRPCPMRYQPIDALKRNSYVHPNWTNKQLKRYMRYWFGLKYFGGIPFEEFTG